MASWVMVFFGGRGSGKTMSMSVQALLAMIKGYPVWANYPIDFDFENMDGVVTRHTANRVEIEDLITFKPEIKDGIICLDELNLWASNRNSTGLLNRLLNAWFQLIRKRNLSVYITTQDFHSLDKFIRYQTDLTIKCSDLHYMYPWELPEGASISQRITDWSGYKTGRDLTIESKMEDIARNTEGCILNARRFWGIYDSWSEVDILQAMTKYEVQREVRTIGRDDENNAYVYTKEDIDVSQIQELKEYLSYDGRNKVSMDEMVTLLEERGIKGDMRKVGKKLKQAGFQYKQTRSGAVYLLEKE